MKKLLTILVLSFLLFSCKEECKIKQFYTYKKGDIVYLKSDSIRATITYINTERKENYDVEFYVIGERISKQYVDTIYFYNSKKLKK